MRSINETARRFAQQKEDLECASVDCANRHLGNTAVDGRCQGGFSGGSASLAVADASTFLRQILVKSTSVGIPL